jgi:hypothetical protein
VRSVSQRLEGIEDGLDRLDERLAGVGPSTGAALEPRLDAIEDRLEALIREVMALRAELPGATEPVPSRQERLKVSS